MSLLEEGTEGEKQMDKSWFNWEKAWFGNGMWKCSSQEDKVQKFCNVMPWVLVKESNSRKVSETVGNTTDLSKT